MKEAIFHIELKTKMPEVEIKYLSCPVCKELSGLYCHPHYSSFRRCAQKGCNGFIQYDGMYSNMTMPNKVFVRGKFSGVHHKKRNKILKERMEKYDQQEEEGVLD